VDTQRWLDDLQEAQRKEAERLRKLVGANPRGRGIPGTHPSRYPDRLKALGLRDLGYDQYVKVAGRRKQVRNLTPDNLVWLREEIIRRETRWLDEVEQLLADHDVARIRELEQKGVELPPLSVFSGLRG
jgi:hypothetical protein